MVLVYYLTLLILVGGWHKVLPPRVKLFFPHTFQADPSLKRRGLLEFTREPQ